MKVKHEREVAQSCPTLRDPMDCSLPDSSIHGIFQATVLEWVAIAFSFHVLAIVNRTAMNFRIHVSFSVLFSSGYRPSSGIIVLYGSLILRFFLNLNSFILIGG